MARKLNLDRIGAQRGCSAGSYGTRAACAPLKEISTRWHAVRTDAVPLACESVLGGEESNGVREGRVSGAELQAGEMRSEVLALASLLHGGAAGASCGKRESAMA